MATLSSIVAGKFHGQRSLVGCGPRGCKDGTRPSTPARTQHCQMYFVFQTSSKSHRPQEDSAHLPAMILAPGWASLLKPQRDGSFRPPVGGVCLRMTMTWRVQRWQDSGPVLPFSSSPGIKLSALKVRFKTASGHILDCGHGSAYLCK